MNGIENKIKDVTALHAGVSATDVLPRHRLRDDLGLDSLDHVELAMALEDSFGIEILDEHMEDVETVGDLVGLVRKLTEAK